MGSTIYCKKNIPITDPVAPEMTDLVAPHMVDPIAPDMVDPVAPHMADPVAHDMADPVTHDMADPVAPEIVKSGYCSIFLLGQGGVGKTTLSHRLTTNKYEDPEVTHGTLKNYWTITSKNSVNIPPGFELNVVISDMGGQDIYQQLHPLSFSDNSIYVLMYNMVSSICPHNIFYDVYNIVTRRKHVHVLIVFTKSDKIGGMYPSTEYILKFKKIYPQIINTDIITVSSLTGDGIQTITDYIASTGIEINGGISSVPLEYVELKKYIQDWSNQCIKDNKVPVESTENVYQYILDNSELSEKLGGRAGISEGLNFLKKIGSIVFHQEQEFVILDPIFIDNVFRNLVTANPEKLRKYLTSCDILVYRGILMHDQETLKIIWPDSEGYTDSMRIQILKITHIFNVSIDDSSRGNDYSFVPGMLTYDETMGYRSIDDEIGSLNEGETQVGLFYETGMPASNFWMTFLQKWWNFAIPEKCRRTKAILQYGDNRAMLKLKHNNLYYVGNIEIIIRGKNPIEFRSILYRMLTDFVKINYPYLDTKSCLHVNCHVCNNNTGLYGRMLREILLKKKTHTQCMHCVDEDVYLEISDLINTSIDTSSDYN